MKLRFAVLLFLLSLILRITFLNIIPVGIPNDNMIFVINSKAVYYTGHDVSGRWNPFSLKTIPDEPAQAELPYIFLSPVIGPLQSSLLAAHIFYAVINSLLVVLIFIISFEFLNPWAAFTAGLVASFNPWNISFGRSAFEASLALFFYMAALYVVIKTKSWKKLLTVIPLSLGFYTYMAYKTTFLPFAFLISFFAWREINRKKYFKQYAALIFICLAIFFFFVSTVRTNDSSQRISEAGLYKSSDIERQVNNERRLSIQNPLAVLLANKPVAVVKTVASKYIEAFSPERLFINTKEVPRFAIYNHGYFYLADFIFIILGFCYLFSKKKNWWAFLTSIIFISPLPSVLSTVDSSYAMRSSLYIPIFCIFIGIGIWYTLALFKKIKLFKIGIALIILLYAVLILNFLYIYFFIQPVQNAEGADFSARVVSRYASIEVKENKNLVVVTNAPKNLYKDYMYYSGSYSKDTAGFFRKTFLNYNYSFKSVSFKKCQDVNAIDKNTTYIFDPGEKCILFKNLQPTVSIAQLSDSGTIYKIYQDSICSSYRLKPYLSNFYFSDFDIENLSRQNFCEKFIIKYQTL